MVPITNITGRLGNQLFQYAYIYAQAREGNISDTFLQDPKYFEKYADEIRQIYGEGIGSLPQVSIHYRRGTNPHNPNEPKYSENPFYVNLSKTDYYEKAIEMFPDRDFLVFSDDVGEAKEKFKGGRFKVVEGQTDIEDFNMMASCQSNIIANSSFSWWAGYLNKHVDKVVVAPSKEHWYNSGIELTVCPPQWIRI
jgi:hypothetical protein